MATHQAVVTTGPQEKLAIIQVPTVKPEGREVLVRVEWTASTPLDLHQNDGQLLVKPPQILGDSVGGVVVEIGSDVTSLKVGDTVFGFLWREKKEKAQQEFVTAPEFLFGKLPEGYTLSEAVTLNNNFVTVFHAVSADLGLPLLWPVPDEKPQHADSPILIWGASSSVGQFALQILRHYGYRNLLGTASQAHHQLLKSYGAREVFDYRSEDVARQILTAVDAPQNGGPAVPFIFDCIASKSGSLAPIAEIAQKGSIVAILLPVIIKDASETSKPEYEMDVDDAADWADGVEPKGVKTHGYLNNEMFKEKLQSEIMPNFLANGIVQPNKQRIVEGETLLERAQTALDTLRRKEVSGERLVWRVAS